MKSYILIFLLALPITLLVSSNIFVDNHPLQSDRSYSAEGEELLYEVSWSGITIGTIRLKTLSLSDDSKPVKHRAVAYIDSRSGLPFVNIHLIAFTEMDSSFNSLGSYSYEKLSDGWQKLMYRYNLSEQMVIVEEMFQEALDSSPYNSAEPDTLRIPKSPIQDGISLVYLARHLLQVQKPLSFPTLSNKKLGEILFYPPRPQSTVMIDAWEKPIRVIQLSGKLILEGILGLTGDYKGWFSDDNEAVPITAEMKVLLGSVKIELKQWNLKGWNPPDQ